ncbi:MAG TPA: sugar ABC transporter substrate-binding protein, partial [Thermomicrobiales bacterium]|nr:sugar ABC transporter substrate-binding protein [Thermomicrobiales bacterium]
SQDRSSTRITPSTLTRRTVLKTGAAAGASAFAMPYFFSRTAAQDQPLTFWQFYAPGGDVASQATWFEEMVQSWNDQNDVQIELRYIPSSEYISGSTLSTAFASQEGPDIFIISPGDFLRYYNGGVLQDLTPFMEQEAIDDFFPDVLATRMVDGKVFGLPMEVEPMAFFYSRAAWDEAGLTDSDIPQTWDQLLEVGQQLTTDQRFGVLFDTNPGYYQNFTWYPFMWQGGAEIQVPETNTSGMRDPGAVAALKFWQDAVNAGVAPRTVLGGGGWDVVPNLSTGYCAIQNVGIWAISALQENAPDFEYGIFKLPIPEGGTYTTDLGGWAFVANSQGQNPEAAAQFIVWALGSMSEDSIQRGVTWCTEAKSDMAPRQSVQEVAEQGGFSEGPLAQFAQEILPGGRAEPRVTPEIYKSISDAIQAAMLNGTEPEQAAEQAATEIEAFLATYTGAPIL